MSLHPEVQRKAQAELDRVVGCDRLPDHADQKSLPYINAIMKETVRWNNVLPIGVPHLTLEDMEYKGYFIPARTVLVPNIWYVTRTLSSLGYEYLNRTNRIGRVCMTLLCIPIPSGFTPSASCMKERSTQMYRIPGSLYLVTEEGMAFPCVWHAPHVVQFALLGYAQEGTLRRCHYSSISQ